MVEHYERTLYHILGSISLVDQLGKVNNGSCSKKRPTCRVCVEKTGASRKLDGSVVKHKGTVRCAISPDRSTTRPDAHLPNLGSVGCPLSQGHL